MLNRSYIKKICDGEKKVQFIVTNKPGGVAQKGEMPFIDIPDYVHYNYAYECAYDIQTVEQASPERIRKWFREKKNKQRLAKYKKYMILEQTFDDMNGEPVEY